MVAHVLSVYVHHLPSRATARLPTLALARTLSTTVCPEGTWRKSGTLRPTLTLRQVLGRVTHLCLQYSGVLPLMLEGIKN